MTLHDVTRMNDEAHGHAQVYANPLASNTTRIISARSSRKPGYNFREPKDKVGKNNWFSRASAQDQFVYAEPYNPASDAPSSGDGRGILRDFSASPRTGFAHLATPSQATMLQSATSQAKSDNLPLRTSAIAAPDNPYANQIRDEPGIYLQTTKWTRPDMLNNNRSKESDK